MQGRIRLLSQLIFKPSEKISTSQQQTDIIKLRYYLIIFKRAFIMLIRPLSVVTTFLDALNESLDNISPNSRLTRIQTIGLSLILIGLILTETLNWAAFERRSLKKAKSSRLRWIFYYARIPWQRLLEASIRHILSHYNVNSGTVTFDDSEKQRTKKTTKIPPAINNS